MRTTKSSKWMGGSTVYAYDGEGRRVRKIVGSETVRTIHFLLHVVDGVVSELEIYKDDSSAIVAVPNADKLDLILLPPPPKVDRRR